MLLAMSANRFSELFLTFDARAAEQGLRLESRVRAEDPAAPSSPLHGYVTTGREVVEVFTYVWEPDMLPKG